jgi:hypothetical protein
MKFRDYIEENAKSSLVLTADFIRKKIAIEKRSRKKIKIAGQIK